MGQILHGSATTTETIRRAIQHREESLRVLAKRYAINQKTARQMEEAQGGQGSAGRPQECPLGGAEHRRGGNHRRFFRKHTLLPLDDRLYALQATPRYRT